MRWWTRRAPCGRTGSTDDALTRLAEEEPQLARVVECRFYGGMSEKQTAAAVGVTVRRDWLKAKAWLQDALA